MLKDIYIYKRYNYKNSIFYTHCSWVGGQRHCSPLNLSPLALTASCIIPNKKPRKPTFFSIYICL